MAYSRVNFTLIFFYVFIFFIDRLYHAVVETLFRVAAVMWMGSREEQNMWLKVIMWTFSLENFKVSLYIYICFLLKCQVIFCTHKTCRSG
jgi:hypothetical protein